MVHYDGWTMEMAQNMVNEHVTNAELCEQVNQQMEQLFESGVRMEGRNGAFTNNNYSRNKVRQLAHSLEAFYQGKPNDSLPSRACILAMRFSAPPKHCEI